MAKNDTSISVGEFKKRLKGGVIKTCASEKRAHPESKLQQECVKWFRLQYPQYKNLLFAIPNGGARSKVEAGIMAGEGVLPGVADLMLVLPKGSSGPDGFIPVAMGLFIEMKFGKGKQSAAQIAFEQSVKEQGYQYSVCRTIDEFMYVVNEYLK